MASHRKIALIGLGFVEGQNLVGDPDGYARPG